MSPQWMEAWMAGDEVMPLPANRMIARLEATRPALVGELELGDRNAFLSTVAAAPGDRRLAGGVVVLSALVFIAAVPFAQVKLPQINGFIPAYEAALILISGITAVMLFGQFRWSRSPALLVLAAGYLYDMLLIVPHALSFPDAFAPGGLLGGGQTTVWLFCFWHGGFPLFVIGYALLSARERNGSMFSESIGASAIGLTIIATAALAATLTALALNHDRLLPTLMAGNTHTAAETVAVTATWVLGLAAIAAIWRQRQHTVLDLWLMVMLCAWVFDIALSAIFNHQRFDLGFYAGRGYGLLAASFVLGVLLTETGGLHSRLAKAKALVDNYARSLEQRVRSRTADLEAETAERHKAEALLHQAQKMEALGQLTGGLAHDFNNHLGIIIGNLDLLAEEIDLRAEQKELVDDALAAAFNGAELTRHLLAFARRQPLRPQRIEINRLIENITKLLRRTLGPQMDIRLELDPEVPAVVADPSQLETAIANLANNARDAMPDGGGRLTITTGTRYLDADYAAQHLEVRPGQYAMIEVSDTGAGMAPETLTRVFEPFFTTKEPGRGTGLGLSMVFGFIKQSGGHINVYSELGRGTTFRLYLPPEDAPAEEAADTGTAGPALRGRGEHILVVEDNAKLRAVLVRQLGELGYRVSEAESGGAALVLLDRGARYDLLLSDVVMPGTPDGYGLARQFLTRQPGAKVLLTSGFPGARLAEVNDLNADLRLLDKPYRRQDLALALRDTLAENVPAPG
jgi:signal transduction histidine kinase/ActR/RegA family two-component response regulator